MRDYSISAHFSRAALKHTVAHGVNPVSLLHILLRFYLAYLAVSLLLILPLLNFLPTWYVNKTFNRKLDTEIILFNPFTLSIEARQIDLPGDDGRPFVGFSAALVDLSVASIWSEGWVFDAFRIEGLYADIVRLESGDFNFTELLPPAKDPDEAAPAAAENSAIPGLTVRDFFFQSEWIKYTDRGRERPFTTHYDGLEIAVSDLSTVTVDSRPYTIDARGEASGELHWEGQVSLPAAHSEGFLSLSNISVEAASRFIEPWVRFELRQGRLGFEGQYSLNWDEGLKYRIEQAQLMLAGIVVAPREGEDLSGTGVTLGEMAVTGLEIHSGSERVNIESISLEKLAINGWSEGTRVSLAEMFRLRQRLDSDDTGSDSNWSAAIAKATISDSRLRWRSEYTDPPVLVVSPLEATVRNIQWPPEGDSTLAVNLAVNDLAYLDIDAVLGLASGDGEIEYKLHGLPVEWFNPNLPKAVNASIDKGSASVDGGLTLLNFAPSTVHMNGEIADFSLTVQEAESAITAWESVRWRQLNIDLNDNSLVLNELFLDGYSGRLHIFADGTINSQRAMMTESEAGEADSQGEVSSAKPWSYAIPSIIFTDSQLDFMDESLPIPFRTVIGDMNGRITGISSNPTAQTTVDLHGSVDGYAPVTLTGTARPFASPPALDLGLNFDGVDLARLTPYSGTYAGYAIDRGILNLDLKYTLEDTRLDGHNKIVIAQLKLGEKIESDKAVDVPLGLAVALLTDMNGVIDLEVPVSGNTDDPEFDIGGVIFSALLNILTKAVTAPFALLASLVQSQDDLQRVTFASGSTALDDSAKSRLDQLTEALTQRPKLVLVLYGRLHPRADRAKLQLLMLEDQIIAQGLSQNAWDSKGPDWVEAISSRYAALTDDSTASSSESIPPPVNEQLQWLASKISVPDEQLEALAAERAAEVKRYLVNDAQLPAERAVIDTFDINDKANLFSGVEMKIDT